MAEFCQNASLNPRGIRLLAEKSHEKPVKMNPLVVLDTVLTKARHD